MAFSFLQETKQIAISCTITHVLMMLSWHVWPQSSTHPPQLEYTNVLPRRCKINNYRKVIVLAYILWMIHILTIRSIRTKGITPKSKGLKNITTDYPVNVYFANSLWQYAVFSGINYSEKFSSTKTWLNLVRKCIQSVGQNANWSLDG